MNGIDRISKRLVADAQARIDEINANTDAKCEEIRAEYEEQAKKVYDERIAAGDAERESRLKLVGSTAEMEAKKAILAFKQELLDKTFQYAIQRIITMPKDTYVHFLAIQAAKAVSLGTEELIFNAKDASEVGKETVKAANAMLKAKGLHPGLTLSEETREIPGGLIVRQGNIEVNCAVDMLVQMSRNELATQVAEILFT